MHKLAALILPIGLLIGCQPTDETDGEFVGGRFNFETYAVTDTCLDGALEAVYLPEGPGTTNPICTPIYLPAVEELPYIGGIPLGPPFQPIEVTITGEGNARAFEGAENESIELDPDTYPDCVVDMAIGVNCTISGTDDASCVATLDLSNETGVDCPVLDSPCELVLDIRGNRL